MDLDLFTQDTWVQNWAGSWCFLSCSHFADQYTKELKFGKDFFKNKSVIFVRKGKAVSWARKSDIKRTGEYLSSFVKKDTGNASLLAQELKKQSGIIFNFIENNKPEDISLSMYEKFWEKILVYYHAHISVKYVVDYLEPNLLEKFFSILQEARVHAEPVFIQTEKFTSQISKVIGEKLSLEPHLVLCTTKKEMLTYLKNGKAPTVSILRERFLAAVVVANNKEQECFTGEKLKMIETSILTTQTTSVIEGQTAYTGKVKGIVKIIFDVESESSNFNEGDILVAGMTRPEYLPLMKKAAAFVTDSGGILSHAAIVARELKKPCIIGTQIATKVLKNGDMVEVDAERGIVKKI